MIKLNDIIKKNNLKIKKIEKIGKVTVVETDKEKLVLKDTHIDEKIIAYLKSRNFEYMPLILENKEYNVVRYINDYNIPKEQKLEDLVKLTALLHNKTTHYKKIDIEKIEKLFEQLKNNINYLYSLYTDKITLIESKVFMSPSEQLFAANITDLYKGLDNNKKKLSEWYDIVKNKKKERNVVIHNNLKIDHFLRNEKSYLISWDKSKIDSPVFDLYKLFRNEPDTNFEEILEIYEKSYPLTKDEKLLLELLIEIPEDISFKETEYERCIQIIREIDKCLPKTLKHGKKQESKN